LRRGQILVEAWVGGVLAVVASWMAIADRSVLWLLVALAFAWIAWRDVLRIRRRRYTR
jgi:hypothetical protein